MNDKLSFTTAPTSSPPKNKKPRQNALAFLAGAGGLDSRRELRALVVRGSDSPPDCHSLPLLLQVLLKIKSQDKTPWLFWQGLEDLNPRHSVLETDVLPTELNPYER